MQFTPPLFPKFGSSADDLLKKKLDSAEKHEIVVKTQSKNITTTSTVNTKDGSTQQLDGKINLKYEDKQWGEIVLDAQTSGKLQKDLKLTQLAPNTVVTVRWEGDFDCSKCLLPQGTVQYKQDAFAGQIEFIGKKKELLTSGAVGYEGFSIGACLKTDVGKLQNGQEVTQAISVDGGLQYEERNLTATLTIESATNTVGLSYFHLFDKQTQLAAKLMSAASKGTSFQVAAQHTLSPETMVKGKVQVCSDKSWAVATHCEHKVASPNLVVGVTAFYDSKKASPAFGVSAQFSGV